MQSAFGGQVARGGGEGRGTGGGGGNTVELDPESNGGDLGAEATGDESPDLDFFSVPGITFPKTCFGSSSGGLKFLKRQLIKK